MSMHVLYNARIVTETRTIPNGFLVIDGDKIAHVQEGPVTENYLSCEMTDCEGMILAPGFIDLHCHGGGDSDFMDGTVEDILTAARAHLVHGTTTIAPTTLTCSDEELYDFFDHYEEAKAVKENMPRLCGVHLEGPYFSKDQAGAQPPRYLLNPTKEHYEKVLERSHGNIFRWSVAPELEGAMELGDVLKEKGILASIGHSNATYDTVVESMKHGFSHITHFYAACSSIVRVKGVRVLGVVECGYLFDDLDIEIIADGMHLPPELLRLIVKTKDNSKISLVTDSMRGATMPEGPSVLGSRKDGLNVIIEDGIAKMLDFSGFAGSVATTDRLVRTMVNEAGLELHEAVNMMSLHPARLIKKENELGSIAVGKLADLVLLDDSITAKAVYVGGVKVSL